MGDKPVCPRCGGDYPVEDESTPEPLDCPACGTPATEDGKVWEPTIKRQYRTSYQ